MGIRYLNKTDAPIKVGNITIESFTDYFVTDATTNEEITSLDALVDSIKVIKYVDGVLQKVTAKKPVVQKVITPEPEPEPIVRHAPTRTQLKTTSLKR